MPKKLLAALLSLLLLLTTPIMAWAQPNPRGFIDIGNHWGAKAINEVVAQGWMHGMGSDRQGHDYFEPLGTVTRAQAAIVLARMFTLDYDNNQFIKPPRASDWYQDVDNSAWYAEAIRLCAINNIFQDSDNFYPERVITRLEMAKAIQNCFAAKRINVSMIMMLPIYEDIENLAPGDVNAIAFVTNTAIMGGNKGYFLPHDALSRAALAQVLINTHLAIQRQMGSDSLGVISINGSSPGSRSLRIP